MNEPILILGAGINGVAIARQLLINGRSVVLVDRSDVSSGATAFSSRLIHGGLRYLEYAELGLVRESLHERTRLLELAPEFVKPLQLFIPTQTRLGGAFSAAAKFFRLPSGKAAPRGAWLVRAGLTLYDLFARIGTSGVDLPWHRSAAAGDDGIPPVDPQRFRWVSSYYDAQIQFPERFVLGMVRDCESLARESNLHFQLLTYHEPRRDGDRISLQPRLQFPPTDPVDLRPAAIVNATGACVDMALQRIEVPSTRLMGGTKGSHLITFHQELRDILSGGGIYAEADDGRPVFLLPLGNACLVGTTDIFFDGDPEQATASRDELDYLVQVVNRLFPQLAFSRSDIEAHYCGVRPLPYRDADKPAASVTRSHVLHNHPDLPWPMVSIIGGKLTTCRSLAEDATAWLADRLDFGVIDSARDRAFPGVSEVVDTASDSDAARVPGTTITWDTVERIITEEYVRTLKDLALRRLMLLYHRRLRRETLEALASKLAEMRVITPESIEPEVRACVTELADRFGKRTEPSLTA